MQVQTKGKFGGLGIEITMEDGVIKIVSPIDDTPAAQAGLKPADLIIAVNDEPIRGMTLSDAVDRLRGEVGSSVTVTIKRGAKDPFDVTLKRDTIKIRSVRAKMTRQWTRREVNSCERTRMDAKKRLNCD